MSAHNQDVNLDFGDLFGRTLDVIKVDPVNWAILGVVGTLALGCGGWGGWQNCAKKQLAGQKPEVNDVLYPFSNISLIIPALLAGLAAIPCVFPGMILAFLWALATPLMVRDGLDWKDATRVSKAAVMANLVPVLLLALVASVIANAGSIAFGVGVVLTMPFAVVMQYIALDSFVPAGATPQQLDYSPGVPAPMGAGAPAAMAPAPMAPAPMAPAPMAPAPMAPAPMALAPMAPAPAAAPAAAAPMAPAPAAPAPMAPTPAASAPMAPDPSADVVETAQQATAGEAVAGKTMAMSAVDFEAMLKNRNNGDK
jgi:hypothetical protein